MEQQSNGPTMCDTLDYRRNCDNNGLCYCLHTKFQNQVQLACIYMWIAMKYIRLITSMILILSVVDYFFSFVSNNYSSISPTNTSQI